MSASASLQSPHYPRDNGATVSHPNLNPALTEHAAKASRVISGEQCHASRAALAGTLGADPIASTAPEMSDRTLAVSQGAGADAVLTTADTASDQPVALAGEIARD